MQRSLIDPVIERGISPRPAAPEPRGPKSLSSRQAEVLRLYGDGLTYKEIATRLSTSAHTVIEHLRQARERLAVTNSREAARASQVPVTSVVTAASSRSVGGARGATGRAAFEKRRAMGAAEHAESS